MTDFLKNCGHTYEEHVDVTDNDLRNRVMAGTYDLGRYMDDHKKICSRFLSEELAEKTIKRILKIRESQIKEWMQLGYAKEIEVVAFFTSQVGIGFAEGTGVYKNSYPMYGVRVVLQADIHFRSYSIVTAYPVPNKATIAKIAEDKRARYAERRAKFAGKR